MLNSLFYFTFVNSWFKEKKKKCWWICLERFFIHFHVLWKVLYMLVRKIFCVPAPLRESTLGGKREEKKKVEAVHAVMPMLLIKDRNKNYHPGNPCFIMISTRKRLEHIQQKIRVTVVLLSMEGEKALGFHQKYLNLCSEDERRSYGFGTTWGWVINGIIFSLGELKLFQLSHLNL